MFSPRTTRRFWGRETAPSRPSASGSPPLPPFEERAQMNYNHIAYPVNLGNWVFTCDGQVVITYYDQWAGGNPPEPYAGGFGLVVWNEQSDDGNFGTDVFNIWWAGPGQFALQATDTGIFAVVAT